MATYDDTIMQQLRLDNPSFDSNEMLAREFGCFAFAKMATEAPDCPVTPQTRQSFMANPRRDIKIPVLKRLHSTVTDGLVCQGTGHDGVSALVTPTFTPFSFTISNVLHRMDNNDIPETRMMLQKYADMRQAILEKADTLVLAALSTNKTQVMESSLAYAVASNTVNATWAQREFILRDLDVMMRANKFTTGQTYLIGNPGMESLYYMLAEYGLYNEKDKSQQLNKNLFLDNLVVNATGKYGTCYAVKSGSLALLYKFTPEQVAGDSRNNQEWGITDLPGFGPIGFHRYSTVGDQSAVGGTTTSGLTCSIKDDVVYSVSIAVVPAYNSAIATIANPIIKADIAADAA